jgi:succinate dehydrogenase/fumarate reductase flavoprotein subunit
VWPFARQARPAPRGHQVAFDGPDDGGALAMSILIAKAEKHGVRTLCDTRVTRLLADGQGTMCGVEAVHFGKAIHVGGRRGVILAAGGYGANAALVAQYNPGRQQPHVTPIGSPHEMGAGLLLGLSAGGCAVHTDSFFITSPFYPPEQLLKGIIVNALGRRFVAEDSYHARTADFIFRQPQGIAFLIVDSRVFAYPEAAKIFNHRLVDGWDDADSMARGLNVPPGTLAETLNTYNADARRRADDAFHKAAKWLVPLDRPPYAAFDLSVGKANYSGFSLGGLRTAIDGEVLSRQGAPIPGLWAVGACASNIAQDCVGYASGTRLAEGSYFGRRAGRAAAR